MGTCVSIHKDPDSTMKFRLSIGSKTENQVIPSPVKEKPIVNGNYPIADGGLKSQWSTSQPPTTVRDIGSKEETFFDSQPWLDSDCDDDFFSVNGDFTPSRGSTPVHHTPSRGSTPGHHSFSAGPLRLNNAHFDGKVPGSKPPPSPKKRLSELFRESFQKNKEVGEHNITVNQIGVNGKTEAKKPTFGLPPRSANSTPFASGANSACSSERIPTIGDYVTEKEEPMESMRCCIPRVLSSRGFSGRKTPPHSIA